MNVYHSYYKNVQKNMSNIGLWPYDNRKYRLFLQCFFIFVLSISIILQVSGFLLLPYNTKLLLKFIIRFSPTMYSTIGYTVILIKNKQIKKLFDQIRYDCELRLFKNQESEKIIKIYAENIKQFIVVLYTIYVWFIITLFIFLIEPFATNNFLSKNNERRIYNYPISIGYYEKFQSHFFIICIALCNIVIVESIVCIVLWIIFLHLVQHSCAMFCVTGYMFEHAFIGKEKDKFVINKNEKIYEMLVRSIKYHNKSIRFLNNINSFFEKIFLFAIFIALCILISDILYFSDIKYILQNYAEAFLIINLLCSHFFFIFVSCYMGQRISDHGVNLSMKLYNYPWYVAPLKIQKMYLMVLMKSTESSYMSIGKIFNFSYELIVSILHTAVSYAIVFHSL